MYFNGIFFIFHKILCGKHSLKASFFWALRTLQKILMHLLGTENIMSVCEWKFLYTGTQNLRGVLSGYSQVEVRGLSCKEILIWKIIHVYLFVGPVWCPKMVRTEKRHPFHLVPWHPHFISRWPHNIIIVVIYGSQKLCLYFNVTSPFLHYFIFFMRI